MRIAFLLLLSLSVQAQLPVVPLQRFVSGAASPPGDMYVWLKNESIQGSNNNDLVSFWRDSSGNGHNYAGGTIRVTNNLVNGLPGAYCSGSEFFTGTNSDGMLQNVDAASIFIVITNRTTANFDVWFQVFAGTSFERLAIDATGGSTWAIKGRSLDADSVYATANITLRAGWKLIELVVVYTNTSCKVWTNSVSALTDAGFGTANKTSNTASSANSRFGNFGNGSGTGLCAELLGYNRAVTDSERTNNIEPYFRAKFNLW